MSSKIFQGIEIGAKELKRYEFSNLRPHEKNEIWKLDYLFIKENDHIKNRYFKEKIQEYEQEKNRNEEFWNKKWEEIEKQLKDTYVMQGDEIIVDELEKSKKNFYKQLCPSDGKILVWRIAFCLSVIGETSILLVQGLLGGGFNPMILLFAGLLGLGGWLCGNFLGAWFWQNQVIKLGKFDPKTDSISTTEKFKLFVGGVLIIFVATVRAIFSTESEVTIDFNSIYIFTLTLILGLVVACTEGVVIYLKKKRDWSLSNQQSALKMYASKRHLELINDGSYRDEFFRLVREKGGNLS